MNEECILNENGPEAYIASFKKTILAVKCVIQQVDYTVFPALQHQYNEFEEDTDEAHPELLQVVQQMGDIAQRVLGKLEDALKNQRGESSSHDVNNILCPESMRDDVKSVKTGKKALGITNLHENTAHEVNASFTTIASDNESNATKDDCIMPFHKTARDHNENSDLVGKSVSGNFKVLFEKVIMYHKKYSTLLQSWKQLNGKVNKCRKLITETNCSSSEKIQQLVNNLSNVSKENKKLHLKVVSTINQTEMYREKMAALNSKKACILKNLEEKDSFLEELKNETVMLSQCLRSFHELKQILLQHLHKKRNDFEKKSEQIQLSLAQKQEELENLDSMSKGNRNTIIPPIKSELQSWKNSLHEANKEVEKFTKYLYALRKKKECSHHEHALIERSIDELRSHILIQQESFRTKEKKCKQSKLELENKYRELRNQLQKITNATLLDDMCYANIKLSENADAYKNELSTLVSHQNESKANKRQINEQIQNLNESIEIHSLQLVQTIETSHQYRQQIISECSITKGQLLLQSQGLKFLQKQEDKLREEVIYLHQQLEKVKQSEDKASHTYLIFLDQVRNIRSNLRFLENERENQLRSLGFRGPMVMLSMEEQESVKQSGNGCRGEQSERIIYEYQTQDFESLFMSNLWEYINEISYEPHKFESIHNLHYPANEINYKNEVFFSCNFENTKNKYHLNDICHNAIYVK